MHTLIERLLNKRPVITDGAWGTELQARGLSAGDFPDAWNLTNPDKVLAVACAYVEAGSDIILTNTFGANAIRLRDAGIENNADEINRAGVKISRAAAGAGVAVFASIGPSGKLLANGDITAAELDVAFRAQAESLATAGADALVIESMSDIEEASIAVTAARGTGLPVVACMVFDSGKEKDRTMMGATPEQVASALSEAGADVIGANCGRGIQGFEVICRRLHAATDRPIWIKPNAGLPVLVNGQLTYDARPEDFAACASKIVAAGASFIGGCCGTNPDFVRALRELVPA